VRGGVLGQQLAQLEHGRRVAEHVPDRHHHAALGRQALELVAHLRHELGRVRRDGLLHENVNAAPGALELKVELGGQAVGKGRQADDDGVGPGLVEHVRHAAEALGLAKDLGALGAPAVGDGIGPGGVDVGHAHDPEAHGSQAAPPLAAAEEVDHACVVPGHRHRVAAEVDFAGPDEAKTHDSCAPLLRLCLHCHVVGLGWVGNLNVPLRSGCGLAGQRGIGGRLVTH
jgi:hypothetical protein